MLKLIKLIVYRITHNKVFLMTYLILIPLVIGIAVYFTNNMSYHVNVALVGDIQVKANNGIEYEYLQETPNDSTLVLSQYDAIVTQDGKGIKVTSTKGEDFNQGLLMFMQGHLDSLQDNSQQRGNATNILGFLMMIVLLLGVQIYKYYFDERGGINKRILGTSVHGYQYMLSHFIVVLGFLFVPASVVISSALILFKITIAFSLWEFIAVLFLLCLFATAFGLWMNSLSRTIEESMMFGNMFAIGGSIISGGFVQVTNNQIFNNIVQFLPQKQIMSILEALEKSTTLPYLGIIYVFGISIVLIMVAIVIEKRKLPLR